MTTTLFRKTGERFFTADGAVLAGGYLYYYRAGTSTPQDTYADSAGAVANTNPVLINAAGQLTGPIYLGSGYDYKEVLTTLEGATVFPWPFDNIPKSPEAVAESGFAKLAAPWISITSASSPLTLSVDNAGSAYAVDATAGNITINLPAASGLTDGHGYWFKRVDGTAHTVSIAPNGADTIDGVNASMPLDYVNQALCLSSTGAAWKLFPLNNSAPTLGKIAWFVGNVAPSGYLAANGALVSRTTYAALFSYAAACGAYVSESDWSAGRVGCFSVGNGSTTFRLPDLRGYFVRGWANDSSGSLDYGRVVGSFQEQLVLAHTHAATSSQSAHSHNAYAANFGRNVSGGSGLFLSDSAVTATTTAQPAITTTITANVGAQNIPQNVAMLACVAYV